MDMGIICENQALDKQPAMIAASSPLAVSVIICTKDRCRSLDVTLREFRNLDLTGIVNFELIIIDNNSSDQTPEVVADFARTVPFPVLYRLERRRGGSAGKNLGFTTASGDVVMLTDDDCIVSQDWVQMAVKAFDGNLLQVIGGRVELHDQTALPLSIKTDIDRQELKFISDLFGFMHGANMVVGRAVLEKIGGFDIRIGPGTKLKAAEDVEFIYRAFEAGIPIMYEPDLIVRHNHGRTGAETWHHMMCGYAIGSGAMTMKHLLHGHTALARAVYWDFRAALRDWRRGRHRWSYVSEKLFVIIGAVMFLYTASWRPTE